MLSVQHNRQSFYLAAVLLGCACSSGASAQNAAAEGEEKVFDYEERSTMHTIPFQSLDQDALSNTVIEGGLAAPAAGVPARPVSQPDEDYFLDPLALQPRDDRTDLGRHEIPVEIRFSNPKSIPGQTFGNNYVIRPPENRTYDTLNTNLQDR
ncbi:hypothetical protein RE428_46970 [Marinobacter nanhaiticus D15-8W]|uniref:Uncharacterized protein n=1 Tax=Marinobacter nanhaiticus D15-8W TaxID=626887 RepID=N6WV57_9GAMM|nr:hypothetical protein [Marinobacter nanhaiticus]ENO15471.1 hypothetical protein J057_08971 [Marinobacter nanhaiticus D15-8W]BES73679.1 hypothetical protein RE428_46970 [Marinobacter nanhaiticus D15-8W]